MEFNFSHPGLYVYYETTKKRLFIGFRTHKYSRTHAHMRAHAHVRAHAHTQAGTGRYQT